MARGNTRALRCFTTLIGAVRDDPRYRRAFWFGKCRPETGKHGGQAARLNVGLRKQTHTETAAGDTERVPPNGCHVRVLDALTAETEEQLLGENELP